MVRFVRMRRARPPSPQWRRRPQYLPKMNTTASPQVPRRAIRVGVASADAAEGTAARLMESYGIIEEAAALGRHPCGLGPLPVSPGDGLAPLIVPTQLFAAQRAEPRRPYT